MVSLLFRGLSLPKTCTQLQPPISHLPLSVQNHCWNSHPHAKGGNRSSYTFEFHMLILNHCQLRNNEIEQQQVVKSVNSCTSLCIWTESLLIFISFVVFKMCLNLNSKFHFVSHSVSANPSQKSFNLFCICPKNMTLCPVWNQSQMYRHTFWQRHTNYSGH